MKTIGILGGMSAASTQTYYRELCLRTRDLLGGLHSPDLLIRSINFAVMAELQSAGQWDQAGDILNREAKALERGGADFFILATNTMHKLSEEMLQGISIPFLHIADATALSIQEQGLRSPALMATAFTMEEGFYIDRLIAAGLTPVLPESQDRAKIHRIIYDELCREIVLAESQEAFVAIANRLVDRGADCLILGCTEIGMLLHQTDIRVPVFDTTLVHCDAALAFALA